MAHPNEAVIRSYVEALASGDLDAVGQLLADDVTFHIPGRNPMSGEKRGREEALAMFRGMMERSGGPITADVHDLLANDEHAVALVTRTLAGVEARAVIVYHVREGKIGEVWVLEADQFALDEALS